MANSATDIKRFKPIRGIREAIVSLSLDDTYLSSAGGWVVTPSIVGFDGILDIQVPNVQEDTNGTPVPHCLVAAPIPASVNWGIRAYQVSDGAEEGDGAGDFDDETIRIRVLGY